MNLKDQLPNLGVEQNDGSLKIGEHIVLAQDQWCRPDYDEFNSKEYQTEFECANILTGIADIDTVKLIVDNLAERLNIVDKPILYNTINNPQWLEYTSFLYLLEEIRDLIDCGVKSNKLIEYPSNNYKKDEGSFYFSPYVSYDTLQFLEYMHKNSFLPPDELNFVEREDGTLDWLDEGSSTGEETLNNIEERINQELQKIYPELERFYTLLKEYFPGSLGNIDSTELYNVAIDNYENSTRKFIQLLKKHIDGENIYRDAARRDKMILGSILQVYINDKIPLAKKHKIITSKEFLLAQYNKIKKSC